MDDCIGTPVEERIASMASGDVMLLENVRFHAGEEVRKKRKIKKKKRVPCKSRLQVISHEYTSIVVLVFPYNISTLMLIVRLFLCFRLKNNSC